MRRGCACACGIDRLRAHPHTSRMAAKSPAPPPSPVAQFEQSLDELEKLVQKMEQGEMSLDESLAAYERGVGLYRQCQAALEQAELRVKLLTDPAEPGQAQPFEPDAGGSRPRALAGARCGDPGNRPARRRGRARAPSRPPAPPRTRRRYSAATDAGPRP